MPWAPPAPAHSSRRSWSSSRVFQPSFQLVEAPVPPAGDPQQPLAAMCQCPPAGGSAGHQFQGKHFPLDRLGASSSCICLQRKKKPKPPFPKPLQPPRTSRPPGESKGHPGLVRSGSPSTPQLPHPTGTSLPVPQGPNPAGFRSFRRYRGLKSWEASPGTSQSFGPWAQPCLRRGQRNGAVTNPPAHSSPWEQTQLSGSSLLAPGSPRGIQGARMEFAGRQNRGSPRCLLRPSTVTVLKRRVA